MAWLLLFFLPSMLLMTDAQVLINNQQKELYHLQCAFIVIVSFDVET